MKSVSDENSDELIIGYVKDIPDEKAEELIISYMKSHNNKAWISELVEALNIDIEQVIKITTKLSKEGLIKEVPLV